MLVSPERPLSPWVWHAVLYIDTTSVETIALPIRKLGFTTRPPSLGETSSSQRNHYTGHVSTGGFKLTSRGSISLNFVQDLLSRGVTSQSSAKIAESKGFVPVVFLGTGVTVQHKMILPSFHARTLSGAALFFY